MTPMIMRPSQSEPNSGGSLPANRLQAVYAVLGLVFLAAATVPARTTLNFLRHATAVQGVDVDVTHGLSGGKHTGSTFRPVFEFTDTGGKLWHVTSPHGKYDDIWSIGSPIAVLYDAADAPASMTRGRDGLRRSWRADWGWDS